MSTVVNCLLELEMSRLTTRMDTKPKRNLVSACEQLQAEFARSCHKLEVQGNCSLIGCYNLGALLQYHYGELNRAEQICHRAIEICQALACQDSQVRWTAQMIQPYINLGRIAAARGDSALSLRIYDNVYRLFHKDCALAIDGYLIYGGIIPDLNREDPSLAKISRNVYVLESIRALLQAYDYEGLLKFLDDLPNQASCEWISCQDHAILEGRMKALLGMSRCRDALSAGRELITRLSHDGVRCPAVYTVFAEIYRQSGHTANAGKALDMGEKGLMHENLRCTDPYTPMFAMYLIALERLLLQDFDRALVAARTALTRAGELCDEVGVIKALIILTDLRSHGSGLSEGDSVDWYRQLETTCGGSFYRFEKALAYAELANENCRAQTRTGPGAHYRQRAFAMFRALQNSRLGRHARELSNQLADAGSPAGQYDFDSTRQEIVFHKSIDSVYERLMKFSPAVVSAT